MNEGRRELGLFLGVCIVVNSTIGTGIFKTPAAIARLAGSVGAAMLVWVVGGVIALAGALSMAELAAAHPRTGGIYEYLRLAYGPKVGFLFGWTKLTLLIPSAVGSFAKLAAESIAAALAWPVNPRRDSFVAVGFVALAASVNVLPVRRATTPQAVVTVAKYCGVALVAGLGLWAERTFIPSPPDAPAYRELPTIAGVFAALVSVMWAYDGWADLSSVAGEVREPARTLPRAFVAGTLVIVAIYLLANAGYLHALGLDGLRRSTTGANMAAANVATAALGSGGRRFLAVIVFLSCIGGCMSSLLTGARIFVPMSTDGMFPRALGAVSPKTGVPARAVLVAAALGAAYVTFRSFEQLTDGFVVGYFPFYMAAVVAVFLLRRRGGERPFSVPLYPLTPIVFLVGAAALLIGAVSSLDRNAWFAFGIVLLGIPLALLRGSGATTRPADDF